MEENKNKFNAFKTASIRDWEVAARLELNGSNSKELVYQGTGWSIQPFYDQNSNLSPAPLLPISENKFLGPRTWYNCPYLKVTDAIKANEKALEYLRDGADGIFFELNAELDFEILLKDIEWQYCSLNFLVKKNQDAIALALHDFIAVRKTSKSPFHGAFFGNIAPPCLKESYFSFAGFQMIPSASPVDEIVAGFNLMLASLKGDFHDTAGRVAFSVAVGTDFFLEIAKLRAIRQLWNRLLVENKIESAPLFIHGHSMPWSNTNYQPHGNMLKSTTAAMAAILGGCDAITIDPEDNDHSMMIRVARNVSNILREESHFSKVADPLAGSYFIEDLTQQLTSAAWESISKSTA